MLTTLNQIEQRVIRTMVGAARQARDYVMRAELVRGEEGPAGPQGDPGISGRVVVAAAFTRDSSIQGRAQRVLGGFEAAIDFRVGVRGADVRAAPRH